MPEPVLSFLEREYHPLIRFLRYRGASPEDAQDAAQEACAYLWKQAAMPGFWSGIREPKAWIRQVAWRCHCRPGGRRRRADEVLVADPPELADPTEGHADLTAATLTVVAFLRQLDSDVRAVMAYQLDGFSAVETARALGLTDQRVRDLRKKGRAASQRALAAGAALADSAGHGVGKDLHGAGGTQ